MKTYKVKKGDNTLNLKSTVVGYPILDANWGCVTQLLEFVKEDSSPIINRAAPKRGDNTAFDVYFTSDEIDIDLIREGKTYFWQITMSNPTLTPPFEKTEIRKLEIEYKGG